MTPQNGKQTRDDHRHGHRLGTHAQHGSFANRLIEQRTGGRRPGGQTLFPRILQIDQHDDAELRGDSRERDESNGSRDRYLMPEQKDEPEAPDERERQSRHDEQRFVNALESHIQKHKDHEERKWHDDFELRLRALQIFELPGPAHRISRRQGDGVRNPRLHILDRGPQIAST